MSKASKARSWPTTTPGDRWLKGWRIILQDDTAEEEEKKQIWNSLMEYAVGKHNNVGRMRVMMDNPSSHV
jgi:hypothetical protein